MRRSPKPDGAGSAEQGQNETTSSLPASPPRFVFVFSLIGLYPAILPTGKMTHLKKAGGFL